MAHIYYRTSDWCIRFVPVNTENSMFRHRRSYEQRRKSKDGALGNTVKGTAAGGGKPGVFATENCTVVVAQMGGTATLPCVVRKFSNGVVSLNNHIYLVWCLMILLLVDGIKLRSLAGRLKSQLKLIKI